MPGIIKQNLIRHGKNTNKIRETHIFWWYISNYGEIRQAGNLQEDNSGVKRRRRAASLSDSEIMTIKIMLVVMSITVRNFLDIDLSP